jgi:hypothetical protein
MTEGRETVHRGFLEVPDTSGLAHSWLVGWGSVRKEEKEKKKKKKGEPRGPRDLLAHQPFAHKEKSDHQKIFNFLIRHAATRRNRGPKGFSHLGFAPGEIPKTGF